jgi:hypothetical protein
MLQYCIIVIHSKFVANGPRSLFALTHEGCWQERTTLAKAQMKGVSSGMSLAVNQANMAQAMGRAGVAMGAMNQQVDAMAMAKMLRKCCGNDYSWAGRKMDGSVILSPHWSCPKMFRCFRTLQG